MEIGKIEKQARVFAAGANRGKWTSVQKAISECDIGEGFILTNTEDSDIRLTRSVYQSALRLGMKVSIRNLHDGKYQIVRIK